MSKRSRKRQREAEALASALAEAQALQASAAKPPASFLAKVRAHWGMIAACLAFLGGVLHTAITKWSPVLPHLNISVRPPAEPARPFSAAFTITNDGWLAADDLVT